jgi:hypothetical protein
MSRAVARPDIRRPEAVDAAWLTAALQGAGVDAVVAGCEMRPVGSGQMGDTVRFRLTYARGAEGAPATVVGKFAAADPASFQTGVQTGNYVREVMFYRHLAQSALISVPHCYFADVDAEGGQFVLLLEDLAPAEQGDQLKGVGLEQARLVMDEAAKLHGSHWGDPALDELPWIWASKAAPIAQSSPQVVQATWRGFRERYDGRLSERVVRVGERFAERIESYRSLPQGPRCLTHYDFRPDNMMFATAAGGRPVTVVDWQSAAYAAGAADVAYFLAGALRPEVRRAHEAELLSRYHDRLLRLGVKDYDVQALQRDYAVGGFRLLMTAFLAGMGVKQTPRGDEMFIQMSTSAAEHILDNDALSFLD